MIDAHVHIFPALRPYSPDGAPRNGGRSLVYPCEQMIADMEANGISSAVILAGPVYGDWNSYALEAMQAYKERFLAAAAFFDPWRADAKAWYQRDISEVFKGVKLECSCSGGLFSLHQGCSLDDEIVLWLCRQMEQRGQTLVLDLGKPGTRSYQTGAVVSIAKKYPDLKIVLCHMGQPGNHIEASPEQKQAWREQVSVAKLDNVWLDFAAIPCMMTDVPLPVPQVSQYLEQALDLVGVRKLMWGSDVPWLSREANYGQIVELARLHTAFLSEGERHLLLHGNAETLWME